MKTNNECPVCGRDDYSVFYDIPRVPVHVGVLWPSENEARNCAKGEIAMSYCTHCGFIGNSAFDPDLIDYTLAYDNALHFSPLFQEYERALAERLVERYGLRQQEILEIGCGNGHFLGLICELGDNRGTGCDPSHDEQHPDPRAVGRVKFIKDYFSEKYAYLRPDFVCCRHVLEHIDHPREFLQFIHRTVPDGAKLYFEVPNTGLALRERAVWDIIYEHCDYFTAESLGYLFESCGFEILDLQHTYADQFLGIEVRPRRGSGSTLVSDRGEAMVFLSESVATFAQHFQEIQEQWQKRLTALENAGKSVVVWGAGAKAVSFMNMLPAAARITHIVDVNPGKQGCFLAGAAQKIIPPAILKEINPDAVIIVNPIYVEEIKSMLNELGLTPELMTL